MAYDEDGFTGPVDGLTRRNARLDSLLDSAVERSEAKGCGKASEADVLRMARALAREAGVRCRMDTEGNVVWL